MFQKTGYLLTSDGEGNSMQNETNSGKKIIIFSSQTVIIQPDFKTAALKIHLFRGMEGWFHTLREDHKLKCLKTKKKP